MEQGKPLMSVIVPVYNVENYLERCLDSILAQTYGNLEVLLIDDASRDNSGAICDAYAARDSRVRVIHFPENRGPSAARNTGIQEMSFGMRTTMRNRICWRSCMAACWKPGRTSVPAEPTA